MNRSEMEDRLVDFAARCAKLYMRIKGSHIGSCYGLQLVRSSSSVGANYAEATHENLIDESNQIVAIIHATAESGRNKGKKPGKENS